MTDLKLDLSTLSASDLDGIRGIFAPMAALERNSHAATWGKRMVDAIDAEIACRLSEITPTPQTITLDLADTELMFVANLITSAMDAGTSALADWGEAALISVAGELNRRGKRYQTN